MRKWNISMGSLIFFVCLYLYTWISIEPRLIYHCYGTFIDYPFFTLDWGFLTRSLSYPGGIVDYIGGFLSQLYYFSWLGALVVTVIAWIIYVAVSILLKPSAGSPFKLLCYLPAVVILIIQQQYANSLNAFLTLLVTLWSFVVYEKMASDKSLVRVVVFLVMFVLLYYLVGGVSFTVVLFVMVYELFVKSSGIAGVIIPAVTVCGYFVARYVFGMEIEIVSMRLITAGFKQVLLVRLMINFCCVVFPVVLILVRIYQERGKVSWRILQNKKFKWAIKTAMPIAIFVAGIFITFNSTKKKLVQLDYFAQRRMWREVLQTADRIPRSSYDVCCIHDINRALYYTRRLGDDMFRYPQMKPALMFTSAEVGRPSGRIFLKRCQLLLELGQIGHAEKDAFEYLELVGNSPLILEQIATIKLIRGQVEAAKVFLRILSKDLIFGDRGREMLRVVEKDPDVSGDKGIQYVRSIATEIDNAGLAFDVDDFFQQLLDKNSNNKLAFEYMMAFYLLSGRVDKVAANIRYLNNLGYKRMPRCYEEAVAIYLISGQGTMDMAGWKLGPEVLKRARAINKIFATYGGIPKGQSIRNVLGADYSSSYFLYYIFGLPRTSKSMPQKL